MSITRDGGDSEGVRLQGTSELTRHAAGHVGPTTEAAVVQARGTGAARLVEGEADGTPGGRRPKLPVAGNPHQRHQLLSHQIPDLEPQLAECGSSPLRAGYHHRC